MVAKSSKVKLTDIDDSILSGEVCSYLTLSDVDEGIRKVSTDLNVASEKRKSIHLKSLKKNKKVLIFGLQSETGKLLNGTVGVIDGSQRKDSGRFPIKTVHKITGVSEVQLFKPQNLNTFIPEQKLKEFEKELDMVKYTDNARVREAHGMFLDNLLTLARFSNNILNGGSYFQGSFETFQALPRSHPSLTQANSTMYTFWTKKPSLTGRVADMSILDKTVLDIMMNKAPQMEQLYRSAKWHMDGKKGELFVRNMFRFMRSWEKERVSGKFFVTHVFKTGTIMVATNEDVELGEVYLVKGMASVVGELFPRRLPTYCDNATLLPLYNFLVYDGIITAAPKEISASMRKDLEAHVQTALKNGTVVTGGKSYMEGLWDSEPPALPTLGDNNEVIWSGEEMNVEKPEIQIEITEKHKKLATRIAKLTKTQGGARNRPENTPPKETLVFRRYGYSEKENPDRICACLLESQPVHVFNFSSGLTYSLDEILEQLLTLVEEIKMPQQLCPDDLSIVAPLKEVLDEAFEKEGLTNKVAVYWYPPPTTEETAYANFEAHANPM